MSCLDTKAKTDKCSYPSLSAEQIEQLKKAKDKILKSQEIVKK